MILYNTLPHFKPKSKAIEFICNLGEEAIQNIDLINPLNNPLYYFINYEGNDDFTIEEDDQIKIDPK